MSKFEKSGECLDSSLLLWGMKPTNTSVNEIYEMKTYPLNPIDHLSPMNFEVTPQQHGELIDIEIHTKWRVKNNAGADDMVENACCSFVNNIGGAMWSYVDVKVGDSGNLLQSRHLSYAYSSFIETCLNHSADRSDFLLSTEQFAMDVGTDKAQAQNLTFYTNTNEDVLTTNTGAIARANVIARSRNVKTVTKLHCPLFRHDKALPTRVRIRVSLQKNKDQFILLATDTSTYAIEIFEIFLKCRYIRPTDYVLNYQETKLLKDPALYDVEYGEITTRSIGMGERTVRFENIFPGKIPKIAFFGMLNTTDLIGSRSTNPFIFSRMRKLQLYVENKPYFTDSISMVDAKDSMDVLSQLYKAVGCEYKGSCLIDSTNLALHQIIAVPLTADRTHQSHLNLTSQKDIRLEIDIGYHTIQPHTLLIYSIYDRVIEIDGDRNLTIIE